MKAVEKLLVSAGVALLCGCANSSPKTISVPPINIAMDVNMRLEVPPTTKQSAAPPASVDLKTLADGSLLGEVMAGAFSHYSRHGKWPSSKGDIERELEAVGVVPKHLSGAEISSFREEHGDLVFDLKSPVLSGTIRLSVPNAVPPVAHL